MDWWFLSSIYNMQANVCRPVRWIKFIPNKDYRFTSLRKMALPTKLVSYVGWAPSTRKACSMLAKGQSYGTDSNITHGLPGCIFNWLQCLASWQQRCNTAPRRSMMANAHTISDLSQCSVGINCSQEFRRKLHSNTFKWIYLRFTLINCMRSENRRMLSSTTYKVFFALVSCLQNAYYAFILACTCYRL